MSVKKVKISELPQLPQESDASGIFMPAADENNRSYRVPLSRYDKSVAGGDLVGEFPNPTIKSSVELTGSPTAPTPATDNNSTRVATTAYVKAVVANIDARPTGVAGGDLAGSYPNPTIKSSVNLSGSPTAPTPATDNNSTRVATTAFVKKNLTGYVATGDSRLSDSRTPKGTAGGSLVGTYPNPTIASSVNLPGSPTTTTQAPTDNSSKVATTQFIRNILPYYIHMNPFAYWANSTSNSYYIVPYDRGGKKETTEGCYVCRFSFKNAYASIVLVGLTESSVRVVAASYWGNYIHQTANGLYINIANRYGMVGPHGYVYYNNDEATQRRFPITFVSCTVEEFEANISKFHIL